MPSIPCKVAITCPGGPQGVNTLDADSPVANFSSEAPDQILFGATGFPIYFPENPLGPDTHGLDPSVGPVYLAEGCVGPTYSLLSQDDANAQAIRQAYICQQQKRNPEPTLFFNVPQSCNFTCPDGSLFTWTVAAGFVVAASQFEADSIAHSLACSNANGHFMCLSSLAGGCVGNIYNQTVSASVGGAVKLPLGFQITSGALPPGLNLSQSQNQAFIGGTPSAPGAFPFTLQVTDANGNFFQKQYTLNILGISNLNSLPSAVENTPYSVQLIGAGGTAPFTFTLVSGNFPGITLSSSGLLSGTPNYVTAGKYPFTVTITDSTGNSCTQSGVLVVTLRPGPNWQQFNWTTYQINQTPGHNTASGQGIQNVAFGQMQGDGVFPNPSISPVAASGVTYTGPSVTARIILTVSNSAAVNGLCSRLLRNGVAIGGPGCHQFASGTFQTDIVIPLGVNDVYTIDDASPGNAFAQINTAGTLSFTWAIVNV